ncbi:hypothetical protein ONZ45_g17324 [Pleurotus djamor]|nr:hypothetical protein ONZ45_g17324 [Pleurotus djamor]
MVLKLYGSSIAICTKRVANILHEKQVPFELVTVDIFKGEHKKPEYLEKQPFGQTPYIDDDGFILFESRAICRYIEAKYASQGTPLIPKDLKDRAKFEEAASIEVCNFNPYATTIVVERVFKKMRGLDADEALVKADEAALDAKLKVYNEILGKQKYLGGDELTLADLFHLPWGAMLVVAGCDLMTKYPHVARWFEEMEARPSWKAVKDGV